MNIMRKHGTKIHFWAYTVFECEVTGMTEPFRLKNNGQISIMLNVNKKEKVKQKKNKNALTKSLSPKHAVLNEIEAELNSLVGLSDIKKMMKEINAWIY